MTEPTDADPEAGHEHQSKDPGLHILKTWLTCNVEISAKCSICGHLNGMTIGYEAVFPNPLGGEGINASGEPLLAPPAHPGCRCSLSVSTVTVPE